MAPHYHWVFEAEAADNKEAKAIAARFRREFKEKASVTGKNVEFSTGPWDADAERWTAPLEAISGDFPNVEFTLEEYDDDLTMVSDPIYVYKFKGGEIVEEEDLEDDVAEQNEQALREELGEEE
jgi:hypothetical protein